MQGNWQLINSAQVTSVIYWKTCLRVGEQGELLKEEIASGSTETGLLVYFVQ